MIYYDMIRYGMICYDIWYILYSMVWYGMKYDMKR